MKTIIVILTILIVQTSYGYSGQPAIKEHQGEPHNNMETIIDYDGNKYATVKIGDQIWMTENLRSLHYSDGTKIKEVYTYDDDEQNASIYGRLYTWKAAVNKHNICPEGWRIPTDDDWKQLEKYLGMAKEDIEDTGWRDTDSEAIRLKKEQKDFLWFNYSQRGVNSSGLSVLAAGVRSKKGSFFGLGSFADFWSSTSADSEKGKAWNRSLTWSWPHPAKAKIYRKPVDKKWGFSLRLIKDY